ncbi:MAG: hypothetical protein JXP34_26810 [Planctomycetes bacterium]|nr:hypothetical protein [Planctomycetota bacterium]
MKRPSSRRLRIPFPVFLPLFVLAAAVGAGAAARADTVLLRRFERIHPYREGYAVWTEPYTYMDVEDTTLDPARPAENFGGAPTLRLGGGASVLLEFGGLHRAIWRGARIREARITLRLIDAAPGTTLRLRVRRVLARWRDGPGRGEAWPWSATYLDRLAGAPDRPGRPWRSPGASAPAHDRALVASFDGEVSADARGAIVIGGEGLAGDLAYWYGRPYWNYGWLIEAEGDARVSAGASESPAPELRPSLEIVYDRPSEDPRPIRDLNVTFIERTPRYTRYLDRGTGQYEVKSFRGEAVGLPKALIGIGGKNWPDEGETVTFRAHVRNTGDRVFEGAFTYVWLVDEREVARGRFEGRLGPYESGRTFEHPWRWDADHRDHRDRTIAFWVDPEDEVEEFSKANNFLEKYVEGRTIGFWVEEPAYRFIASVRNALGTYSFEDYLKWHFDVWNETYLDKSRFEHPAARDGCLERVSLDRIAIVAAGTLCDFGKHTPKPDADPVPGREAEETADLGFDGEWGSAWVRLADPDYERRKREIEEFLTRHAVTLEGSLLHEMSHQALGAFDIYWSNMEPSWPDEPNGKVRVKDGGTSYIARGNMYPFGGLMGGGDTRPGPNDWQGTGLFSLASVGGFNTNLPYRGGFYGEWQYDIPRRVILRVLDACERPIPSARVAIWQAAGPIIDANRVGDEFETDAEGRVELPLQESGEDGDFTTATGHTLPKRNVMGRINVVGSNTTLLVRAEARGQREYRFLRVIDLNRAFWAGERDACSLDMRFEIAPFPVAAANVATRARASSSLSGAVAQVIDGDPGTGFDGGAAGIGASIVLAWDTPVSICRIELVQSRNHGAFFPRFIIETDEAVSGSAPDDAALEPFARQVDVPFAHRMALDKDVDPKDRAVRWVSYAGWAARVRKLRIRAIEPGPSSIDEIRIFAPNL